MEAKEKSSSEMSSVFRSPFGVLMIVIGIAVVTGGPYALYKLGPLGKTPPPAAQNPQQPQTAALDGSLDVTELDSLPQSLHDGALLLLTTLDPEPPDSIANLGEPMGDDLLHPVSEAVEETQPTLYWSATISPPYTVTVLQGNQVVARGQGLQNTSWMVPQALRRGGSYTWMVTSAAASERASFRVIDEGQITLWKGVLTDHPDSRLALGTVAQQLGMLGIAERHYMALTKAFPESEMAARLLGNVTQLRDR